MAKDPTRERLIKESYKDPFVWNPREEDTNKLAEDAWNDLLDSCAYMPVGDLSSDEVGSGARANAGKPNWALFPSHLMEEVVRAWEHGEKKYKAWNWAKGMAWSVPYACIMRHLIAYWWKGERNDRESGCSHLSHIVCNIMMLMHYETYYPQGDDRPKEFFGG